MIVVRKEPLRKMVNRMRFFDKKIKKMHSDKDETEIVFSMIRKRNFDYIDKLCCDFNSLKTRDENLAEERSNGTIIARGEKVANEKEDILTAFDTEEELYRTLNATKEILTDISLRKSDYLDIDEKEYEKYYIITGEERKEILEKERINVKKRRK